MKKILLNILTHGDELVGKKVADEITRRYDFLIGNGLDIQIANERAYKEGRRYISDDLNRVFPGKTDGSYEERRSYELKPIIEAYELVIDIHSTESGSKDMVIVTKIDEKTLDFLNYLSPKYVLYMNIRPDRALISCAKIGLAFEMGNDTDEQTYEKTVLGIERLLSYFRLIPETPSFGHRCKYFEVFSDVPKPFGAHLEPHINNFKSVNKGEVFAREKDGTPIYAKEDFYPVIFGNSNYETIFGFAARLLTLE